MPAALEEMLVVRPPYRSCLPVLAMTALPPPRGAYWHALGYLRSAPAANVEGAPCHS